jgi:hypothetical protein
MLHASTQCVRAVLTGILGFGLSLVLATEDVKELNDFVVGTFILFDGGIIKVSVVFT